MKKIKSKTAFAAYHPHHGFGINTYWIRANAKDIRNESGWKYAKAVGWKIVKVKVSSIGKPR